jgi:hypothetical protein
VDSDYKLLDFDYCRKKKYDLRTSAIALLAGKITNTIAIVT